MRIDRVIVFHGYLASPSAHWFGWLAEALAPSGVRVTVPELPNSAAPERERWIEAAAEAIGTPDPQTAIVGHSLGVATALHALDRIDSEWSLGAFVGVSGFISPLPNLPQLDAFTRSAPDVDRTSRRTRHRAVLFSDNDSVVAPPLTSALGDALDAEKTGVPGAGHFLAAEGVTALTQILPHLR